METVHELVAVQHAFHQRNTSICLVGNGWLELAQKFAKETLAPQGFIGEVYTDATLKAFQAFTLRRGLWATFNPRHLWSMLQAKKQYGLKPQNGKVEGDALQQGGTFLLGPEDTPTDASTSKLPSSVLFSHHNQSTGDHADLKAVLKLLDEHDAKHGKPPTRPKPKAS